ncbi:MAG TPA: M57 family metalloprotease [Thermoanaerobaculia bacterium]
MIKESDGIVLGMVEGFRGEAASDGDIVTYTTLRIEQVLKGDIEGESLDIRDLGGVAGARAMAVSGGVSYMPGERVLVFLQQKNGEWTTYGMSLGKMTSMSLADGERILMRAVGSDVVGFGADGIREHVEVPRSEEGFLTFIRTMVSRSPRKGKVWEPNDTWFTEGQEVESYELPALGLSGEGSTQQRFGIEVTSHYPASAYTNSPFRWTVFDAGGAVTYYVSGSQPGYDSIGTAQRALAGWTNDPGSNVNLVYGGTRSLGFVQDGVNAIVYNSSTDVPSGAIGYAKWYANAQHTYKGETFYNISEGDVVMRSGLSISAAAFEEAVTHEVGHTIGFRHSDQGTPASNDAIMRSIVSGRFGSTPGPWDREALSHVYGSGITTPPPCTAPAITAQPTSRTINRGSSTTLTVTATGTGPLLYQWFLGNSGNTGSPIAGATGSSITVNPQSTTSYWVRVTNACGAVNSVAATVTVNVPPPPGTTTVRGDFNFDGIPDLVWRNIQTGQLYYWYMNGANLAGVAPPPPLADLNYKIVGAGEFNADGKQDLLFRHNVTGVNIVWYMNNTTRISTSALKTLATNWEVMSLFQYDRGVTSDILWRDRNTGQLVVWIMSGTTLSETTTIPSITMDWVPVGSGDFNLDGWWDFAWRNTNTHQVVIWYMVGNSRVSTTSLGLVPPSWEPGAVGDYNGDSWPDIVWRDTATGANALWVVQGGVVRSTLPIATEGNLAWKIFAPR